MNTHNLLQVVNTMREKLDYLENEIKTCEEVKVDAKEKTRLDFEAAVEYIKAKARKHKRIPNDDVMLLNELKSQFKGLWGKNVIANLFMGIGRENKDFTVEKYGKNTYLTYIG